MPLACIENTDKILFEPYGLVLFIQYMHYVHIFVGHCYWISVFISFGKRKKIELIERVCIKRLLQEKGAPAPFSIARRSPMKRTDPTATPGALAVKSEEGGHGCAEEGRQGRWQNATRSKPFRTKGGRWGANHSTRSGTTKSCAVKGARKLRTKPNLHLPPPLDEANAVRWKALVVWRDKEHQPPTTPQWGLFRRPLGGGFVTNYSLRRPTGL